MACKYWLALLCWLASAPAWSLTVDEPLADPALEARAHRMFYAIRCVVCQSEAIADSPADIAGDMRRMIRQRIAAGESDRAIEDYLVAHYGHFILMQPPLESGTWLLWFGPLAILMAAALFARRYFKAHAA
jgi:cytochrome c-type biogenesis protein CcmH